MAYNPDGWSKGYIGEGSFTYSNVNHASLDVYGIKCNDTGRKVFQMAFADWCLNKEGLEELIECLQYIKKEVYESK